MNPLAFNAVSPVSLGAVQRVLIVSDPTTGSVVPGLAPELFQRTLQVTPVLPLIEATTGQDAFAAASSADFALQTALRFGAGVVATPTQPPGGTDLGANLVRDATAVLRLGNLQSQDRGPGPEAFAHRQGAVAQVLQTYQALPAGTGVGHLDLLA